MSRIKTYSASHDSNCQAAETTLQTAAAASTTQAATNAAEVTYYKAVRDSARNAGLLAELGAFNTVIRSLNGIP